MRSTDPQSIVILHSVSDAPCAKTFRYSDGDGVVVEGYGKEVHWNAEVRQVENIDDVAAVIDDYANTNAIAVVGALIDEDATGRIPRRKYGEGASLAAARRSWVALDLDDVQAPSGLSQVEMLQHVRDTELPPAFHGVSFYYQFTSSYMVGREPTAIRARLWFILDEGVDTDALRCYFKTIPCVDECTFTCTQPIYIRNPTFDGMPDPTRGVCTRSGLSYGEHQRVTVADMHLEKAIQDAVAMASVGALDPAAGITPHEGQIQEAIDRILRQDTLGGRHNWMVGVACELYGLGAEAGQILDTCEEVLRKSGREMTDPGEVRRAILYASRQYKAGKLRTKNQPLSLMAIDDTEVLTEDAETMADWMEDEEVLDNTMRAAYSDFENARMFVQGEYGSEDKFVRWAQNSYTWTGKYWAALPPEGLESAIAIAGGSELSTGKVTNIAKAVARRYFRPDLDLPCWLDDKCYRDESNQNAAISFNNGMVYVDDALMDPDDALKKHTSRLFSTTCLPYNYNPSATCPRWEQALREWFPGDAESVRELQKMFGYLVVNDRRYQKYFVLAGESRAGKGVVAGVLRGLVGRQNTASTSLTEMAGDFGMEGLVGKTLCFINEANAQSRRDVPQTTVDRIKAIVGNDPVCVNRKRIHALQDVELPCRLVMSCNQAPNFPDPSGAMLNRMHIIEFRHTFVGREDPMLADALRCELPGIFMWALKGLEHLYYKDKKFLPTTAAQELRDDISRMGSPVRAFIEDCIVAVDPLEDNPPLLVDDLYTAFRNWCAVQGIEHPYTKIKFMRDIKAAARFAIWHKGRGTSRPACVERLDLSDEAKELLPASMGEG